MTDDQKRQIEAFTRSLEAFNAALDQLPEESLDWREAEERWSVREIIHHVSEDCNVYAFIIERALATPGCRVFFGEFPGNNAWGDRLAWGDRPVEPALDLMRAHRAWLAETVSRFPDRWDNAVKFYDERGEELAGRSSVGKMIEMLTEHVEEHTETIQRITSAKIKR